MSVDRIPLVAAPVSSSADAGSLSILRGAFDRGFAQRPLPPPANLVRLVAIRAAGEGLTLPVAQIAGIARGGRIVPVLSRNRALLGVTGMRGSVVPVFSLAAILDIRQPGADPLWLALALRDSPIALAFEELEGQVDLEPGCIHDDAPGRSRRYIHRLARVGAEVRPVVDIPSIVESIRRDAGITDEHRSNS